MKKKPRRSEDLREACIAEALKIIDRSGIEQLSLREVARRLGVSHQAPYRHFQSRDHILADIVARAFDSFARHLDAREKEENPDADLAGMGRAYLGYATTHALQYRLMFGTPLPNGEKHPVMMQKAKHAFDMLCTGLKRSAQARGKAWSEDGIVQDALFIWSGLHGLAGILTSSATRTLKLSPPILHASVAHLLSRFGDAMTTRPPGAALPNKPQPESRA